MRRTGGSRIACFLVACGVAGAAVAGTVARAASAATTPSCTDSWVHVGDGDWSTAANWSEGHVPTPSDDVCVTTDASFTITLEGSQTVHSLFLAGTHGSKTLELLATGAHGDAHLTLLASSHVTRPDTVILESAAATPHRAWLEQDNGVLTNDGTISVDGNGVAAPQLLWGGIDNRHVMNIDANTQTDASDAVLTAGTLDIADGVELEARHSVTNDIAIVAAGTGVLYEDGGTYNQNWGTTTGLAPVVVADSPISYTAGSAATVIARGTGAVGASDGTADVLILQATDAEGPSIRSGSWLNGGTFVLTSAGTTANTAEFDGSVTNFNFVDVQTNGVAGAQTITGTLANNGRVEVEAGATLALGGLTAQHGATLQLDVDDATHYGAVSIASAAELTGALTIQADPAFTPTVGQRLTMLNAPSITGAFARYRGLSFGASGLYLQPQIGATAFDLVVAHAAVTGVPKDAAPGQSVTLHGTGWMPNEDVVVRLRDGSAQRLATIVADAQGRFAQAVTIPDGARTGGAHIAVSQPITGVAISRPITVG